MAETSPKHPNAALDPDCTSKQALEEALQIRIAAELHHKTVDYIRSQTEADALALLIKHIEEWRSELETKYTALRQLIGIAGGSSNAT